MTCIILAKEVLWSQKKISNHFLNQGSQIPNGYYMNPDYRQNSIMTLSMLPAFWWKSSNAWAAWAKG